MSEARKNKSISATAASLLLVSLLGYSLAKLMWLILTPAPQINLSVGQIASPDIKTGSEAATTDYGKLIAGFHLFGEEPREPVKKAQSQPVKPVVQATRLNLKLHGIVAYKNKNGYALISSGGSGQKVYGKGDSIQSGVIVTDVLPDKVILDNNGSTEELLLPRKTALKSETTPSTAPARGGFTAPPRGRFGRPGAPPSSFGTAPPGSESLSAPPSMDQPLSESPSSSFQIESGELSSLREEVVSNPAKLMEVINISPAMQNDQFVGFRVQPGSNRQLFRKVGLQPNDIITSVNGILLDDASKGPLVLSDLSQASSVSMTVLRGDEEISLQASF